MFSELESSSSMPSGKFLSHRLRAKQNPVKIYAFQSNVHYTSGPFEIVTISTISWLSRKYVQTKPRPPQTPENWVTGLNKGFKAKVFLRGLDARWQRLYQYFVEKSREKVQHLKKNVLFLLKLNNSWQSLILGRSDE